MPAPKIEVQFNPLSRDKYTDPEFPIAANISKSEEPHMSEGVGTEGTTKGTTGKLEDRRGDAAGLKYVEHGQLLSQIPGLTYITVQDCRGGSHEFGPN